MAILALALALDISLEAQEGLEVGPGVDRLAIDGGPSGLAVAVALGTNPAADGLVALLAAPITGAGRGEQREGRLEGILDILGPDLGAHDGRFNGLDLSPNHILGLAGDAVEGGLGGGAVLEGGDLPVELVDLGLEGLDLLHGVGVALSEERGAHRGACSCRLAC